MKKFRLLKYLLSACGLLLLCAAAAFYFLTKPLPPKMLEGEAAAKPMVANDRPIPSEIKIDRLVVYKGKRQMWAYSGGRLVKIYPVSLGFNPVGHKQFEGDGKTPEGVYRINERNPHSGYHKNLGVSYPNEADKKFAASQGKDPGGLIKIHGLPNGTGKIGRQHLRRDWTDGCIAVTDNEIDELYRSVVHNAEIDIRP
ncbi:murein L,D-transpeptidase family protein [Neisseria dentiae]|uniref:L,D-transpeptidase family protein n=1 Tax=Neisseria dentiae TaxID=194197 RepID=UPI0035A1A8F5